MALECPDLHTMSLAAELGTQGHPDLWGSGLLHPLWLPYCPGISDLSRATELPALPFWHLNLFREPSSQAREASSDDDILSLIPPKPKHSINLFLPKPKLRTLAIDRFKFLSGQGLILPDCALRKLLSFIADFEHYKSGVSQHRGHGEGQRHRGIRTCAASVT